MSPVSRIKELPYPEKKFESHDDAWEYCKELRNSLQEEQSERIEDFDQLKLDNVPWIDVRRYGAKGDGDGSGGGTDDIVAFTAAAASLSSGGKVYAPEGTYRLDSVLALGSDVSLIGDGMGVTILDFSGSTTGGITSTGTATELANLNANITKASRTVTLDGTPAVSEEDLILIYDATTYSFSGYREYYNAGEFAVVDNISSNDINITTATYAAYTDDADMHVYKITPTTMVLQDFSIQGPGAGSYIGVKITYGRNCVMKRVESYDWQHAALEFNLCYDCAAHNVNGRSVVNAAHISLDYGIILRSCQDASITDSFFMADRHATAVSAGGSGYTPPCRNILFQGCHAWNTSRHAVSAMDVHGIAEYATIDNCFTDSIILGGNHCKATNNTIYAEAFEALRIREPLGFDFEFKNNTVYMMGDRFFLYAVVDADTTLGGTFIVKDNTCYMNFGTTGDEIPIGIYNDGSTATDLRIDMNNNTLSNVSGTEHSYVDINTVSGSYFESIKFNNNDLDAYSVKIYRAQAVEVCRNKVSGGGDDMGLIVVIDAPATSPSIVKVCDNTVYNCEGSGLYILAGSVTNKCDELLIAGNISKDNATTSGTRYELFAKYATHAVIRDNTVSGSSAELTHLVYFGYLDTAEVWGNTFVTTIASAWDLTNITTYHGQIVVNLVDDAEIVLPTTPAGWIKVWGGGEMMIVQIAADATCTLLMGTSNAVVADTDAKLCVYDKGTTVGVKNRLAAEKKIYIEMYS